MDSPGLFDVPVEPTRRVSVVIPAKNEAGNIAWVLQRIPTFVDEVVLVDGRSTDRTVEVARWIRPDVVVVIETRPGKGAALRAGVEAATGDDIVMIDADGSMDPVEMEPFLRRLRQGYDLVKGSRFLPGGGTADMTPLRDAGNRCLLAFANLLYGSSSSDLCYGYAAFRRDAFQSLELSATGFEIEAQFFLRARRSRLRIAEVASFEAPRREGNSNLNTFRDGWRVLSTIVAERLRGTVPALSFASGGDTATEAEVTSRRLAAMTATVEAAAMLVEATVNEVAMAVSSAPHVSLEPKLEPIATSTTSSGLDLEGPDDRFRRERRGDLIATARRSPAATTGAASTGGAIRD